MMMVNCFCGMVDRWKTFRLFSNRDHCQRSSPSRISDMLQAEVKSALNLNSDLAEWSCVIVITTTHRHNCHMYFSTFATLTLREKYPNAEFFLVRIFSHLDWIRRDAVSLRIQSEYWKIQSRKTTYLDTFHALSKVYFLTMHTTMLVCKNQMLWMLSWQILIAACLVGLIKISHKSTRSTFTIISGIFARKCKWVNWLAFLSADRCWYILNAATAVKLNRFENIRHHHF